MGSRHLWKANSQGVGDSEDARQSGGCRQMEFGVEWTELSPSVTMVETPELEGLENAWEVVA